MPSVSFCVSATSSSAVAGDTVRHTFHICGNNVAPTSRSGYVHRKGHREGCPNAYSADVRVSDIYRFSRLHQQPGFNPCQVGRQTHCLAAMLDMSANW